MNMEYSEKYLHLGENIDPDAYVICKYKMVTDLDMKLAAAAIATEQSTGTWTGISTLNDEIFERYSGRVIDIQGNVATIAYPVEDFSLDIGGVPQILSVIAGNLFGLEALKGVRLEDVVFPQSMLREFKGPKFGIDGMRGDAEAAGEAAGGNDREAEDRAAPQGHGRLHLRGRDGRADQRQGRRDPVEPEVLPPGGPGGGHRRGHRPGAGARPATS